MADHALSHLPAEDVQRRTPLVELRDKALTTQAAAEKERLSQVAKTSYLLGKLPVETLVEIFTVLIDEDYTWGIKLSHVCGHWRRILIHTPSAWQTLVLSKRRPLRKAKVWKERAKNRIARISVAMSKLDRPAVFAHLQDLSWDHLSSLHTSAEAFIELDCMLSDISRPHTFSKLDELTLDEFKSPLGLSCSLFGPDWKLGILRLSGEIYMMDEWWERIRKLKELRLDGSVLRFSTQVFTTNPSLERLILLCRDLRVNPDDKLSPTSLDNLKTIECRGVDRPFDVLRAISAPSITHFSMRYAISADEPLLHIASRLSLVELHIATCSLDPSTLPTLLSSTPNLETLRINSIGAVVNEMLHFLTPKTVDSQHVLPCRALKHVDVSHCTDLTTSSAYAFVKTRVQHASESVVPTERCAVVESLQVDGCPHIEPDMLPWFRSKIVQFSCVFATRKDLVKQRRR